MLQRVSSKAIHSVKNINTFSICILAQWSNRISAFRRNSWAHTNDSLLIDVVIHRFQKFTSTRFGSWMRLKALRSSALIDWRHSILAGLLDSKTKNDLTEYSPVRCALHSSLLFVCDFLFVAESIIAFTWKLFTDHCWCFRANQKVIVYVFQPRMRKSVKWNKKTWLTDKYFENFPTSFHVFHTVSSDILLYWCTRVSYRYSLFCLSVFLPLTFTTRAHKC